MGKAAHKGTVWLLPGKSPGHSNAPQVCSESTFILKHIIRQASQRIA